MLMKKIIFTDLDGTLLNEKYCFGKALPALKLIEKFKVPLIFCTSKTKAETELYRRKLENKDPFVVENGGAGFVPKKYFDFEFKHDQTDDGYLVIKLGIEHDKIRKILESIRGRGIELIGFADMSPGEIHEHCGLPVDRAKLAKKREFDEPFKLLNQGDEKEVKKIVKKMGMNLIRGGKFYHILGNNDKGKAVRMLINLYRRKYNKITTYGFGDSENDFGMLRTVDKPYLVKRPDGSFASEEFERVDGVGPEGWNKTVLGLLK